MEGTKVKCIGCGTRLESRRGAHRAGDLGLPHVVLLNVEIRRCPSCGEEEVVIPRIEELKRTLAGLLIRKPAKLAGEEIRFLRKCLGWSGEGFARRAGVERETVSRWENGREKIGAAADRFLRLAIAHWQPVDDYEQEDLEKISARPLPALQLRLRSGPRRWAQTPCHA
jgi:putative zinc finger/helix-turn-helix YgiT family protein